MVTILRQSEKFRPAIASVAFPAMRRLAHRNFVAAAVSLVLLAIALWHVEFGKVARAVSAMEPLAIGVAGVCICASILIACFRYWYILRAFSQDIDLATTTRATLLGLVGGYLFFQVIGQTLSRWAMLRHRGVSAASVVVTSIYEKILASAILIVAAFIGALVLYGDISVAAGKESLAIVKTLVLVAISAVLVACFVLKRPLRILRRAFRRGANWRTISIGTLATLFVNLAMLGAYLILIVKFAPGIPLLDLGIAAIIIMLAASLPISFSGWGIRELGAVFAFGYVGVDSGGALAVSIAIGVISALAVAVLTAAFVLPSRRAQRNGREAAAVAAPESVDLTRFLVAAVPIGIAGLVMFHAWVPTGSGFVNVNLADPLALIGGFLFLLQAGRIDRSGLWPKLLPFLGALTAMIFAGLVIGWFRMGYTDWAFINRGAGWIFILGYFASGGLLAVASPVIGAKTVVRILMWVAAVLISADLLLWCAKFFGLTGLAVITPAKQLYGESINPNAFAIQLQLILAGVLGLAARVESRPVRFDPRILLVGLLFAGIFLTQSRTAFITGIVLLVTAYFLRFWRTSFIIKAIIVALVLIFLVPKVPFLVAYLLHHLVSLLSTVLPDEFSAILAKMLEFQEFVRGAGFEDLRLVHLASEHQRWNSLVSGIELFREHPIFGAGLGAGITSGAPGQAATVIHSTPVWILAEFGLVGAALTGFFFLSMLLYLVRRYRADRRFEHGLGLLVLTAFLVFGIPHDIFYQRLFWFFLGLALFAGARLRDGAGPSQHRRRPV